MDLRHWFKSALLVNVAVVPRALREAGRHFVQPFNLSLTHRPLQLIRQSYPPGA
jgi:hypothetical protein